MRRNWLLGAMLVSSLALAACGGTEAAAPDDAAGAPPAAGACLEGTPDCVDTAVPDDGLSGGDADEFPSDQAKADAEALLGMAEDELPTEIRVARRGAETFALTEDYRLGRMTVELDEEGGVFVVTSVVVELPEGPVTFDG